MTTIPNPGATQTRTDAQNDLSDSSMATGAEGSVQDHSANGVGTRGGSDQTKSELLGSTALVSGTVASVENLDVPFAQPDNTPVVNTPENLLELGQDGGNGEGNGKITKTAGKASCGVPAPAETGTVIEPVPVSFDKLVDDLMAACAADREAVSTLLVASKQSAGTLKNGTSTMAAAGAAILGLSVAVSKLPREQQRKFIEGLQVKDKNGHTKNLKYNAHAQESVAIPIAIFGYGHMSGGHVSKMGTIVRYAIASGVEPDGFAAFVAEHNGDKGGGFKNTYVAAKDYFNPGKADAEMQAEQDRAAVIQILKQSPCIGVVDVELKTPPIGDGFDCFIAVRGADGKSRVVSQIEDRDGRLFEYLLATFIPVVNAKVPPVPASRAKDNLKTAAKAAIVISKSN